MSKNIDDLRNHLFEALDRLNGAGATNELIAGSEVERAKTICEVAQVLINSAKVEVEYLKATGQDKNSRSEFFSSTGERLIGNGNGNAKSAEPRQISAPQPIKGKFCRDCLDQRHEVAATRALPSGTHVCELHFRKRTGMAATA